MKKVKNVLLVLSILVSVQNIIGQEMITNFSSKDGDKSSYPLGFVEFNEKIFFGATTGNFGREIWVSNGNKNESYLLKDINPGNGFGIGSTFSESSVIINNTLYFIASDGFSNGEIWKTDGTTAGTKKVTTFLNSGISKLTLVGENFYFLIKKNNLLQVWISDGSEAGTKMVKGGLPIMNHPTFEGTCNNTFIFTFQSGGGSGDSKVWRSDGTAIGTYPITDGIDGIGFRGTSALTQYIEFNDELYFVSRYYLHKTDGTLENTEKITTLYYASTDLINYADVTEVNGKLYFSFFQFNYNRLFIWESDGTESGSKKIYDESSNRYFAPSNLVGVDGNLIFCSFNETGGSSLIKLNLIDYSVSHIKELQDSSIAPVIMSNREICTIQKISNNRLFCSFPKSTPGRMTWVSGLTEESTYRLESLDNNLTVFNFENSFYFSKKTDLEGYELWKSNGTENGTFLIDNINKSKHGLSNKPLMSINSNLIFSANDGIIGEELWKYDGVNSVPLKDIKKGISNSNSNSFIHYKDEIFFVSNDSIHGYELWKTNGTEVGTTIVSDVIEGVGSSYPQFLTVHNDVLYFILFKEGHHHLCKTDGINIDFVKDIGENDYGAYFRVLEMSSSGDNLYFITEGSGKDLWKSDGTEVGTNKLKDFYSCENLTDVNGKLFLTAYESYKGEKELWSTDGTEQGTKLVKDIGIGYSSQPNNLINVNGILFFTASTNESGREIWKSDGTEGNTSQLVDIYSGSPGSIIAPNFNIMNNELYFNANNGELGFELWKTNGTMEGTSLVKDINLGVDGSFPSEMKTIDNLIYFQAYDNKHGSEIWKSDGTDNGTELVSDVYSGNLSSSPSNILAISDNIFFIAESKENGLQVWKIEDLNDYDNDGVLNENDKCPGTPIGDVVNEFGCSTAQITIIPDANFEQALIDLGIDSDGIINKQIFYVDALSVVSLDISEKGIKDLSGIESFKNLETLSCERNKLISIDVSNNLYLKFFNSVYNPDLFCIQVADETAAKDKEGNYKEWYKDTFVFYSEDCSDIDFDDDGVLNENDTCPNTPIGETVDANGCSESQLDDDSDGVMNNIDTCPNTPIGETVDANGCSESQLDDDNDGVMNNVDTCPNTPIGETVDANGCSESQLDDDSDGVKNNIDICPNTPIGETVDENGCSESQLDDDNDGVMNNIDLCPDTLSGKIVNESGCADNQLDDDNDGVTNDLDQCSGTPVGVIVNEVGCPESNTKITIPDANFELALIDLGIDSDGIINKQLNKEDALAVYSLDVSGKEIESLEGIEGFENLEYLFIPLNKLTSLDISNNLNLINLNCSANQLNELDVSKNKELTGLQIEYNNFTTIDISQNEKISGFNCIGNKFTNLDLSSQKDLAVIYCNDNELESLDLSQNASLRVFLGKSNKFKNIDFSFNLILEEVNISSNELSNLNLKNNFELVEFSSLHNPDLGCIQVSNETAANNKEGKYKEWYKDALTFYSEDCSDTDFDNDGVLNENDKCPDTPLGDEVDVFGCSINQVTVIPDANFEQALIDLGIDSDGIINKQIFNNDALKVNSLNVPEKGIKDLTGIEAFKNLRILYCFKNDLTTIDVSKNIQLVNLSCSDNKIINIDVSNNIKLSFFNCFSNQLTSIDVSKNTKLETLYCNDNKLTEIDLSSNYLLTTFICSNNQITKLDVSNNDVLINFSCSNNQITEIDVSENKLLENLNCFNNQLAKIDVSTNIELIRLNCSNNQLTYLDVSKNIQLTDVRCFKNQLLSLDISNNYQLKDFYCYDNQLNSIDVSNNVQLLNFYCDSNQLSNIDVHNQKSLASFSCTNNQLTSLDLSNNLELNYFNSVNNPDLVCIQVDNEIDAKNGVDNYKEWYKNYYILYSEDCSSIDIDGDNILNENDNCPEIINPNQEDLDGDGIGDVCDDDIDGDGILNEIDNCPETANENQEDVDEDGIGDVCDNDIDGDSILNENDLCLDTPIGKTVDANGCTLLPSDNFTIEAISETCPNKKNGQIVISAQESHDYKVTINGEDQSFTTNTTLNNLTPGTYHVCIEVVGVTSPYCYEIEIEEGITISGKLSLINEQLHVEVSEGTLPYRIFVNGSLKFETYQNNFRLKVNHGDTVEVKTSAECEGLFSKKIQLFESFTVYPNPSKGLITITIPSKDKQVVVKVFNDVSQMVVSKTYEVINSSIQVDLTQKPVGVYLVKMYLDKEYVFKVVKK